jgi:flavin reductase (DIM6/NTAB) family NADH-FMN oxidoreductase RutF
LQIECQIASHIPVGDHQLFFAKVIEAVTGEGMSTSNLEEISSPAGKNGYPMIHAHRKYYDTRSLVVSERFPEVSLEKILPVPMPVAVLTAYYNNKSMGVVANSFHSCSLEPPLMMITIPKDNRLKDFFVVRNKKVYFGLCLLTKVKNSILSFFSFLC